MTYNDLIYFFICKGQFCVNAFDFDHFYLQIPPKLIVSVNLRLIKDIFPVKKSIKRFDWG